MQISREGVTRPPLYFVVWDTGYQFLLHGAVASYVTTTVFKPSDVLKFGATNKKVSIRTNTHGFVFAALIFNPIFFTVLLLAVQRFCSQSALSMKIAIHLETTYYNGVNCRCSAF